MLKYTCVLLVLLGANFVCVGQYELAQDSFMADSLKTTVSDDSLAQIDPRLPVLQIWELSPKAMLKRELHLDTLADDMHRLYAGKAFTGLRESLGQNGQPGRSMKLSEREPALSMPFVQGFSYYFRSHHERKRYNARRPFSQLYYGASSKKEQNFEFFHTQNVSPFFNMGFFMNYFNGYGHYRRTSYEGKLLSGFASYEGARLRSYLDINFNSQNQQENGGIPSLSYVSDSLQYSPLEYPPNLFASGSITDYHDIFIQQEWNLLRPFSSLDSLLGDVDRYKLFLGHEFLYDYSARRFKMTSSDDREYFENLYGNVPSYDTLKTNDFAVQRRFTEEVYGGFNKRIAKHIILGARGGVGANFCETRYTEPDSVYPDPNYNSTFYTLHFNGKIWGGFAWEANNKQYVDGHKSGDFLLDATAEKELQIFNDTVQLSAEFSNSVETPNVLYERYIGNQVLWNTSFEKTSYQCIRANINEFAGKYSLSVYSAVRANYIYMGYDALPHQHTDPFSELGVTGSVRFRFWKFVMKNGLTYQMVTAPSVVHVPNFISENTIYMSLLTFKNRLNITFGFDVNFADDYAVPAYSAATGSFYLQDTYFAGMYPVTDFFFNMKLKRMRIYIAYNQLGGKIDEWSGSGSSLGVPSTVRNYTYGKPRISYGLAWYFFN